MLAVIFVYFIFFLLWLWKQGKEEDQKKRISKCTLHSAKCSDTLPVECFSAPSTYNGGQHNLSPFNLTCDFLVRMHFAVCLRLSGQCCFECTSNSYRWRCFECTSNSNRCGVLNAPVTLTGEGVLNASVTLTSEGVLNAPVTLNRWRCFECTSNSNLWRCFECTSNSNLWRCFECTSNS